MFIVIVFGSGARKMYIVRIIENNDIVAYFRSGEVRKRIRIGPRRG